MRECENELSHSLVNSHVGSWSPDGLSKLQRAITKVKTPRLEEFIISLESYWSSDVRNGLAWPIWTSTTQVMAKKKGRELNWQFDSRPRKVRNQLDSLACRWCATCCWKALDEGYNFGLDLTPIGGLHKKLWTHKIAEVPTLAISKLPLGSLETKNHLDATPMGRCRV